MKYTLLLPLLFSALILRFRVELTTPQPDITGIITYKDDDQQGDQTDVGAHVYIIDSATVASQKIHTSVLTRFHYASAYHRLYEHATGNYRKAMLQQLSFFGAETKEKWYALEDSALYACVQIKRAGTEYTVNGDGSYASIILHGSFYVLIQSSHCQHMNKVESTGAIYLVPVIVTSYATINYEFIR